MDKKSSDKETDKKPWEMSIEEWLAVYGPGGPKESEIVELRRKVAREALEPRKVRR